MSQAKPTKGSGCLYGGEPCSPPELARFAELISSRVYMRRLRRAVIVCSREYSVVNTIFSTDFDLKRSLGYNCERCS
jgi:hypothetical protein